MSKFTITVIIALAIAVFAAADFYINGIGAKNIIVKNPVSAGAEIGIPDAGLKLKDGIAGYKTVNFIPVKHIFEKIDLSGDLDLKIYQSRLEKETAEAAVKPRLPGQKAPAASITAYEIKGPAGQGGITYLKVKLQFRSQIKAAAETLNETSALGQNSFFLNDSNDKDTAFLVVQIKDDLFGFRYNKTDLAVYEDVKGIINLLIT